MRANAAALPPWFRTPATPTPARPRHPLPLRSPPPASCPHRCPRSARSPLLSFFAPCRHGPDGVFSPDLPLRAQTTAPLDIALLLCPGQLRFRILSNASPNPALLPITFSGYAPSTAFSSPPLSALTRRVRR